MAIKIPRYALDEVLPPEEEEERPTVQEKVLAFLGLNKLPTIPEPLAALAEFLERPDVQTIQNVFPPGLAGASMAAKQASNVIKALPEAKIPAYLTDVFREHYRPPAEALRSYNMTGWPKALEREVQDNPQRLAEMGKLSQEAYRRMNLPLDDLRQISSWKEAQYKTLDPYLGGQAIEGIEATRFPLSELLASARTTPPMYIGASADVTRLPDKVLRGADKIVPEDPLVSLQKYAESVRKSGFTDKELYRDMYAQALAGDLKALVKNLSPTPVLQIRTLAETMRLDPRFGIKYIPKSFRNEYMARAPNEKALILFAILNRRP